MISRGVLKKFDSERGFGFIKPDDGGGDVFLHVRAARNSGLTSMPEVGTRLEYEVEQSDRGARAVKISVADPR